MVIQDLVSVQVKRHLVLEILGSIVMYRGYHLQDFTYK
jgi:hypothetical protein